MFELWLKYGYSNAAVEDNQTRKIKNELNLYVNLNMKHLLLLIRLDFCY